MKHRIKFGIIMSDKDEKGKVLSVDQNLCIACGACEASAPQYFKLKGDEGKSHVIKKYDEKDEKLIKKVISECPSGAIKLK